MYRLFAYSESKEDDVKPVIDLTDEPEGETKKDGVIDLTGETKEPTLPYFERQVQCQCTLHSVNNAIGFKLIKVGSICESKQGKEDRLESENNGGYGMYSVMEAANTVAANSDLQVIRLDKLFETPEKILTFKLLEDWTVDSLNPRVKNMIVVWKIPYFHMIALRYFENKWWLIDSESPNPVPLNREKFESKMSDKGAELSLQVIYTVIPKIQQIYDHNCSNEDAPIVL